MRSRFSRTAVALLAGGTALFAATSAAAALKKYAIIKNVFRYIEESSPRVDHLPRNPNGRDFGVAVVDESVPETPRLRKLLAVEDSSASIAVPVLGFHRLFVNAHREEGPTRGQTGTGSSASAITWGQVSGWTVSGGTFCNAISDSGDDAFAYICSLAGLVYLGTVDPDQYSTHYDIGTWTFHGTGFKATPFIYRTFQVYAGNQQWELRGGRVADGTIPALPILGIGAVGASLLTLGVAGTRRRR